ncbi:16S rRNA (cytosine1402-N4)-methyltransferase [Aureimonas altamirensis DSM 21988]|uniref:Ribosomal RNA small subunit methyltransferase H n=1 Tax=Aureimonas altamirensis DSM 21988 TaxID=1121026 RepID=A0ABY1IMY2_9HYPH|nr:16S rRNA (cytosine(1402)-N(4))-methyltransferase RsmH [Aureimonas altamirensis]SHJ51747.1 16S rRNA (cytosine1402-N4)-methyltransferase [Aureimonas altamirensis DSM 21988]
MSGLRHLPVLLNEVRAAVAAAPGDIIVDGTFGAGGYSRALLDAGATIIGIDRDPTAIADAGAMRAQFGARLRLVEGRFSRMAEYVDGPVDGVVLDIGVSSMQIDTAERGFSFQKDGPLDMRMEAAGPSAADVVNRLKPGDLARVLSFLGEERQAGRIARAIEARRAERPFETTADLAGLVGKVLGRRPQDKIDPATRTFQALRIYVNDELGELMNALVAAEAILKPGGRLVVVTFHSLEDRIVKRFLRDRSQAASQSRHLPDLSHEDATFATRNKAEGGTAEEIAENPRARSAKLRSAVRTSVPARQGPHAYRFFDLPALAALPQSGAQR